MFEQTSMAAFGAPVPKQRPHQAGVGRRVRVATIVSSSGGAIANSSGRRGTAPSLRFGELPHEVEHDEEGFGIVLRQQR